MKKILFAISLIGFLKQSYANHIVKDTALSDSYGWMVFINEDVIWVPASITEMTKPKEFFLISLYEGGLDVKAFTDAPKYKRLAKSFDIEFGFGQGKIAVLPVMVKRYKSSVTQGSDVLIWAFTKDSQQITIKYQFAATYYTGEILLIRKCDMRKYKKNKRKLL